MFYSAFATLLSLVAIMNQTNNGMKFNHCVRNFPNQTSYEFDFSKIDNTIYYQYNTSSTNQHIGAICQGLGNGKDNLFIYSDLSQNNVDNIARLEWYYTVDSGGYYHLNFNSYNYTYQNFNLRALVNLTYYAIDSNLSVVDTWFNTFDINYSLSDYKNDYNFFDDETHNYFTVDAVGNNLIRMNISVCYVPLSESDLDNAYNGGYNAGYEQGYDDGQSSGLGLGYEQGFTDGYNYADNQDSTAAVIFTGILEVGLLPINIFLQIFNYEVFGINISGLVASLLTVAVILIIIRVILAKSGGGGNKS